VYVGVRELRENLRAYLQRAREGEEIIVTDRGKPLVRLGPLSRPSPLERLIAEGRVRPPLRPKKPIHGRRRAKPLAGTVSEFLHEDDDS
jgi:prevent-host-death family protein